ncbi:MAG: ABC transporter ATP-binding protein [Ruminococcus sp.]|nr:ABC transporter ATP-binding protein [Ruminococcus sp.]
MATQTILKVTDLCKTYITNKKQNNALRNVSFEVNKGEMVAIMGPSGSGKSTLLYTASGMDDATSGEVELDGENIAAMTKKKLANVRLEKMGFIFQQMHMLKNLTILDNIILPATEAKSKKRSRKEIKEQGESLMRKMGIIETAGNDINEVSGGQLQRACICRSMINDPKIIFADEPTGALNRSSSDEVMDMLCSLNRDGTTIMMVTHDARVASKCSRVLFIVDGEIRGEKELGIFSEGMNIRERERTLNNWLMEMGW